MSQIHIHGKNEKKPCSLTGCLCLLKGDFKGRDMFHVQLMKVSAQENQVSGSIVQNKYFELKNSWGADGVPQTRTTC